MLVSEDIYGHHRITIYTNSMEEVISMKFQNQSTTKEGKENTSTKNQ